MKVGVFWETSPGAPKKKLTSIFEAKSEKIELFSCKEWFLLESLCTSENPKIVLSRIQPSKIGVALKGTFFRPKRHQKGKIKKLGTIVLKN